MTGNLLNDFNSSRPNSPSGFENINNTLSHFLQRLGLYEGSDIDLFKVGSKQGLFYSYSIPYDSTIRKHVESEYGITYKLNQYDLRVYDDLPEKESIAILGCSDSKGIGNELEDTWGYKLGKELGYPVWNFSEAGAGIDYNYVTLKWGLENKKIKTVFWLVPHMYRTFTFFQDQNSDFPRLRLFSGNYSHQPDYDFKNANITPEEMALKIFLTQEHLFTHAYMGLDGVENICRNKGIQLIYLFNPVFYRNKLNSSILKSIKGCTLAKDNNHLGPDFQHAIFEYFLNVYKTNKKNK